MLFKKDDVVQGNPYRRNYYGVGEIQQGKMGVVDYVIRGSVSLPYTVKCKMRGKMVLKTYSTQHILPLN